MSSSARSVCDVAVVGGGPGGLAAAISAAQAGGYVVVFEPQAGPIDKPCGEGLMPSGIDALRELGVDALTLGARPFTRLRYAIAGAAPLELELPRPGFGLERTALVAALQLEAARLGVVLVNARAEVERDHVGFVARSSAGTWRARTLVAADGLLGRTAGWLRGARHADGSVRRLGIRARFEAVAPLDAVEVHIARAGEVYVTPLPAGRVNVAVLADLDGPDHGAANLFARALEAHPDVSERLGALVTPPESRRLDAPEPMRVAGDGAFLVGDAGGGIDPVLGCGTSLALESGRDAGRAVARILGGAADGAAEREYARQYRAHVRWRRWLAALLLSAGRHPRVGRGTARFARAAPIVTDKLVALAAGG